MSLRIPFSMNGFCPMRHISFQLPAAIFFSVSSIAANGSPPNFPVGKPADELVKAVCDSTPLVEKPGRPNVGKPIRLREPPPPPQTPPPVAQEHAPTDEKTLQKVPEDLQLSILYLIDLFRDKKSPSCDSKWCKLGIDAVMEKVNIGLKSGKIIPIPQIINDVRNFQNTMSERITNVHRKLVDDLIGRIDKQIGEACSDGKQFEDLESELKRIKEVIEKDACRSAINAFGSIEESVGAKEAAKLILKTAPFFLTSGTQCDAKWCTLFGEVSKFRYLNLEAVVKEQIDPVKAILLNWRVIHFDKFITELQDIIRKGSCTEEEYVKFQAEFDRLKKQSAEED